MSGPASLWYDFIGIIFPRICESCGNTLLRHETCVCNFCLYHLPRTDFHLHKDNPASRLFWGRVQIDAAASLYYFHKGSRVQHLIHRLKYKSRPNIGSFLGQVYGNTLKNSEPFSSADLVIPIPLHRKKLRKRGYNQAELFAAGLAKSMNILLDTRTLVRSVATDTQTKKSRFRRWENVKEVFSITDPERIRNRHVLLVDDVMTTGATLEACAQMLLQVSGVKVSVATIACAIR